MKGTRYDSPLMASTYGNGAVHDSSVTFDGAAAGTVVPMLKLPPGAVLYGLTLVSDGLGAGTTLQVGYQPEDGSVVAGGLLPAASSASAGSRQGSFHPMEMEVPTEILLTTAGGEATGKVTVIPHYYYRGTK